MPSHAQNLSAKIHVSGKAEPGRNVTGLNSDRDIRHLVDDKDNPPIYLGSVICTFGFAFRIATETPRAEPIHLPGDPNA